MKITADTPMKLIELLVSKCHISRNLAKKWLVTSRIIIDGQIEKAANYLIKKGQVLILLPKTTPLHPELNLIYEDPYLLIIEKSNHLLSVPTDIFTKPNVLTILRRYKTRPKIYPVHRLDRDVSGLLVFAKGKDVLEKLKKQFSENKVKREYIALVHGIIRKKQGIWRSYLKEKKDFSVSTNKKGHLAITHYQCLQTIQKKYSLLFIHLQTGKKHQIRVHCSSHNHPIVGDKRYSPISDSKKRVFLHAHRLLLPHPITKKKMVFISPLPKEFKIYKIKSCPLEFNAYD